jgi:hypothetical protein
MKGMDTSADGMIKRQEFVDYYCNVSPVFEEDQAFTSYLKASWRSA